MNYRSPRWMCFNILFDNWINVQFIYVFSKKKIIYFKMTIRRYMMDFGQSRSRRWWDGHFLQMMMTRHQDKCPNSETGMEGRFYLKMMIRLLGWNLNTETGVVDSKVLNKNIIYAHINSYGIQLLVHGDLVFYKTFNDVLNMRINISYDYIFS